MANRLVDQRWHLSGVNEHGCSIYWVCGTLAQAKEIALKVLPRGGATITLVERYATIVEQPKGSD